MGVKVIMKNVMKDINCICLFVKLGLVDQTKCSLAMVITTGNVCISDT